jgi:hypothetical protein
MDTGGNAAGWAVKLTTLLDLVPRSRMVELYLHSPIRLSGVVLNYTRGQLYRIILTTIGPLFALQNQPFALCNEDSVCFL